MRRWIVLCVLAAGIAGCGGESQPVTTTVVQTVTSLPTTTSTPTTASSTSTQSPPTSYQSYSAPDYALDVPAGWMTIEDRTPKTGYVESKWEDPESPTNVVLVDTQPDTGLSAEQDAASVQAHTSTTPGYQQISFEPTSIAGNDGWKWVFELPSSNRVDYFFNACGTSFAVLGAAAPSRFDQLAGTFQHVVESIQPSCSTTSSIPTTSAPTTSTSTPETSVEGPGSFSHATDAQFCSTHTCIENFPNGTGYIVQCVDGEWSHSGGHSGACSDHGGES